jgi:phenylpropionate dioxygenase-like ring-hydroxylating dioxygenase large terminal subunit/AcrR family transcriptional regulator
MPVSGNSVRAERGTREDRRRELIDCAISIIAQNGLSGTTLAKVAAQAGLSAGIVNHHFETKDALLIETLRILAEEFESKLEEAVAATANPASGLVAIITLSLNPAISSPPKVAVWYAFQAETHWRQSYTELCGERDKAYMQAIKTLMAPLAASVGADADILARSFAGLLESYWQDILFEGENFDRTEAALSCLRYLATLFPAQASAFAKASPAPSSPSKVVALKTGGSGPDASRHQAGPPATLPAWTYNSEEFFALETERIFMKEWHIVCHSSQIPNAGDYQTFELLNERVFVIRGRDKLVRGFHNVCRHRAHALVTEPAGQCPGVITCPYHGWGYELNGKLRGVASPDSFAEFDRQDFGLATVDTEVFMGFVFIRFAKEGMSVAERLAPYAKELKHYRFEELVPVGELSFQETGADWKNVWDNYLEGYHFNIGHPGLAGLMSGQYDLETRTAEHVARLSHSLRDGVSNSWSGRMYQKLLERPQHLPESMRENWTYFFVYPLLSFDVYPDVIGHFQVIPTKPGASLLRYQNFVLPEQLESRRGRATRWLNFRINGQVQHEDDGLVRSVQSGLKSSAYSTGILSQKEAVVIDFQSWIRAAIPISKLPTRPPLGTVAARNAAMEGG